MNKRITGILLALLLCTALSAQESVVAEKEVNSALAGADILNSMPSGVSVRQSQKLREALRAQTARNESRLFTGFRIRIYHESSQQAREKSEDVLGAVNAAYPSLGADRTFAEPYFNVTAGYFRTRTDAEKALRALQADYPEATIVKEKFKYPSLTETYRNRIDTVVVVK